MSSVLESPFRLLFKRDFEFFNNEEEMQDNYSYSILEYRDKILVTDSMNIKIDSINIREYDPKSVDFVAEMWKTITSFEAGNEFTGDPILFDSYEAYIRDMTVEQSAGYYIYASYKYDSSGDSINKMECFIEKNIYDSSEQIQYLVKQLLELKEPKKIYQNDKVVVDHIIEFNGDIITFNND